MTNNNFDESIVENTLVIVYDEGDGIDPEIMPHLFGKSSSNLELDNQAIRYAKNNNCEVNCN